MQGALCADCWSTLTFIERPYCERLGTPFAQDLGPEGLLSPQAVANPPVYHRARAVVRFEEGPARQMVHQLKYGDKTHLADMMGRWMARSGRDLLSEAHVLVPVPLHGSRLRKRKFNQAMLLTWAIAHETALPIEAQALIRQKPTRSQVGLSRHGRAANMQGAFTAAPEASGLLQDRNVVLIDDVLTSGATVNAAARNLLRAGAARVDVLVFAIIVSGD